MTAADHANTVREAISLSLGGTTDDALAALAALQAQAETAEYFSKTIDLLRAERDAAVQAAAADHANTVRHALHNIVPPSDLQAAHAALDALAAQAETAEDSDEEIARLEGALDTAHKDYDDMKAERDAAVQAAEQARHERDLILDNLQKEVIELIKTKELLSAEIQAAEQARDALRQTAEFLDNSITFDEEWETEAKALVAIARAALAGNQP